MLALQVNYGAKNKKPLRFFRAGRFTLAAFCLKGRLGAKLVRSARPVRRQALSLYLTASVIRWFDLGDGDGLTSRLANSHPLQMTISLEIRASSSASIAWSRVTHSRENWRSLANSASLFWLADFASSIFVRVRFVAGRLGSRPRPSQAKR